MEIHSIGYHHRHDSSFCIDRPDGIGQSWLFLLFHTPAVVRINNKDKIVKPNSFIIYSGDEPEYYCAYGDEYVDDWFHFTIEQRDFQLLKELDIPINQVVWLQDDSEISSLIRSMTHEFYASNIYCADFVELYLKLLLFSLSRHIHSSVRLISENSNNKCNEMIWLRNRINNNIQSIGSVSELAHELSMSQSAFQHAYKRIFGVNIMSDIINSRLEHAKTLLSTTNLPLRKIAEQSGYNSEFHLMRQFKEHVGMTPTVYRNKCR